MTQFEFHAEYSAFLTVDSPEAMITHEKIAARIGREPLKLPPTE